MSISVSRSPRPTRKHLRLKGYDYSADGAYFLTICVKDRNEKLGYVGRDDLGAQHVELSEDGLVAKRNIEIIESHYEGITIDNFVVMPNHIHILITVATNSDASKPLRPTSAVIPRIVGAFKRFTNKELGFDMWQISYHDHIVRNEVDYLRIWQYIDNNPVKWRDDCYFQTIND